MSGSFARLATVTASTKRMSAVVDGLTGDLVASETDFKCLPLDPLALGGRMQMGDIFKTQGIEAFAELLMTMVEGSLDILEGDVFYVGTDSYKVRAVGQWAWRPSGDDTSLIILEEIK